MNFWKQPHSYALFPRALFAGWSTDACQVLACDIIFYSINYRVNIKSFFWLQTFITINLCGIKNLFLNVTQLKNFFTTNLSNGKKKYVCIPRSFLVINVCNQGKTFCSPCTSKTENLKGFLKFQKGKILFKHIKSRGYYLYHQAHYLDPPHTAYILNLLFIDVRKQNIYYILQH